jgi:hypothetical protein
MQSTSGFSLEKCRIQTLRYLARANALHAVLKRGRSDIIASLGEEEISKKYRMSIIHKNHEIFLMENQEIDFGDNYQLFKQNLKDELENLFIVFCRRAFCLINPYTHFVNQSTFLTLCDTTFARHMYYLPVRDLDIIRLSQSDHLEQLEWSMNKVISKWSTGPVVHIMVLPWFDRKDRILFSQAIVLCYWCHFFTYTSVKAVFLNVSQYL